MAIGQFNFISEWLIICLDEFFRICLKILYKNDPILKGAEPL